MSYQFPNSIELMYLRPDSNAAAVASGKDRSRDFASFISIGKFAPYRMRRFGDAQAGSDRFEGEPPNISVTTTVPCPGIDRFGGGRDLVLLGVAVMVIFYGNRHHAGLFADHVLDRSQIFACQAAMRDDHDPDHAQTLLVCRGFHPGLAFQFSMTFRHAPWSPCKRICQFFRPLRQSGVARPYTQAPA